MKTSTAVAPTTAAEAYVRPPSLTRVIDLHTHVWDDWLLEHHPPKAPVPAAVRRKLTVPDEQISDMQARGVDMHVVTLSNATHGISWGDAAYDRDIHRRANDAIVEKWVNPHPDRFIGAFTVPLTDIDFAVREIERAKTELGLPMLQISTITPDGTYVSDSAVRAVWEAAEAFDVTVFIHPHGNSSAPPLDKYLLFSSVGQPIEEAKLLSSLIYEGVFEALPDLKVIAGHGGGFLPHYYGRMDRDLRAVAPDTVANITRKPSEYLRSIYYDSAVYGGEILDALIRVVGPDKVIMGADYPMNMRSPVEELTEAALLDDDGLRAAAGDTLARLLGV